MGQPTTALLEVEVNPTFGTTTGLRWRQLVSLGDSVERGGGWPDTKVWTEAKTGE